MAKYSSIIALEGTIGDFNFYKRLGLKVARKAGGGFNGDAIKNKPSMLRVRENATEYGQCMRDVKFFKQALSPFLANVKDGTLHQRLASLFSKIKNQDNHSPRGQRNVANALKTASALSLLRGYSLTTGKNLQAILQQPYTLNHSGLQVPNFKASAIFFPEAATHLELIVAALNINFENKTHHLDTASVVLKRDKTTFQPLCPSIPSGSGINLMVVQYSFLQQVNDKIYPLHGKDMIGIEISSNS